MGGHVVVGTGSRGRYRHRRAGGMWYGGWYRQLGSRGVDLPPCPSFCFGGDRFMMIYDDPAVIRGIRRKAS